VVLLALDKRILLQRRIGQIETGEQENSRDPAKILELAQHLAGHTLHF